VTAISLNCWTETDQKAVREQLDRILQSGPFAQSRRRQRFLDYIVTEALAGRGERLKGYNIGLEVFDRPDTFDPAIDPIVRIEPHACATSFANIMRPMAKATLSASIYRRAATRRISNSVMRKQRLKMNARRDFAAVPPNLHLDG